MALNLPLYLSAPAYKRCSRLPSANIAAKWHTLRISILDGSHQTALMVIGAVRVTLTGVVVVANFMGGEKKIQQRVERHYPLDDPRFLNELGVLLGPPFIEGNRHQVLQNGEEIFPAMPAAIRSAKTSITFETYIYWSGDIGRESATSPVAPRPEVAKACS